MVTRTKETWMNGRMGDVGECDSLTETREWMMNATETMMQGSNGKCDTCMVPSRKYMKSRVCWFGG
jgi:hypothetical protein